jgi:uncharacterized membrane protein
VGRPLGSPRRYPVHEPARRTRHRRGRRRQRRRALGALADYGIDDDFIKSLGEQIGPDSSALFVLLRKVTLDKVMPELGKYDGTVMKTSLSNEQEQQLRQALERHTATSAA